MNYYLMKFYRVKFLRSATESRYSEVVDLPCWWGTKEISGWLSYKYYDLLTSGWEVEGFAIVPEDCVENHRPVRLEGLDDVD